VSRAGIRDQAREDLEVERDFLLRSLQDLDEEHRLGDVSDEDYARLHDSYTARAADVLRAIGATGQSAIRASAQDEGLDETKTADKVGHEAKETGSTRASTTKVVTRNRGFLIGGVLSVLAGIVVALVVANTSARLPGDTATGSGPSLSIQQTEAREITQGEVLEEEGQYPEALQVFQKVITQDPVNAVALSEVGWLEFEAGTQGSSRVSLQEGQSTEERAVSVDPGLPAGHAYLGSMYFFEGNPTLAVIQYSQFIADRPTASELDPFLPDMKKAFEMAKKPMPPLTTATS
jgi:tetratricopeptide (TPR) repeat protein